MSTIDPAAVSIEDIDDTRPIGATPTPRPAEDRLIGDPAQAYSGAPSIRQSLRGDLGAGRAYASDKRQAIESAIREEPVKASLYALGAGLVLGLLLRR